MKLTALTQVQLDLAASALGQPSDFIWKTGSYWQEKVAREDTRA